MKVGIPLERLSGERRVAASPESVKALIKLGYEVQIKDKKDKSKDSVFLFNNWMFVSNSTINEIEHPSYDIWLKRCI